MCGFELSTFQSAIYITIDKMCAVLKSVKCAVMNGKCAVLPKINTFT